ncbi:MAG: hypothetical protein ABFQ95_01000 [Pseudomonadota bacterium]
MPASKGNKNTLGNTGGRPETWTEKRINKEADSFLKWANQDDSIILRKYAAINGYAPQWLTYLADKSVRFSETLKIAKTLVGCRREELALKGDIDTGIVKATLATYDEEHRAMLKEMKRAEKDSQQLEAFLAGQKSQKELSQQ